MRLGTRVNAATSNPGAAAAVGAFGVPYKWVALSVTTIGALMFAIDTSIVVLALPSMMTDLHSDLTSMIWVLMGYSLMSTVALLTFGRLADLIGRVRMYNIGFIVFTAASVLCGISSTSTQLILSRGLQGLGGAMLLANSMAIITEAFPKEQRGRALGINAVVWAVGNIAGPLIGGLILAGASWRWVFLVNLPIGIIGTCAALVLLREISVRSTGESFDVPGAILFSSALVAVLFALNQGIALGWTSPIILGLFAAGIVLAIGFYVHSRRAAFPILDFRLFASQVYTAAVVTATFQSLALFAVNLLVVYYLEVVQGQSPLSAALALVPLSIVNSLVSPFGGTLSDRMGSRRPVALGLLVQTAGLVVLSSLQVGSSYLHVVLGLLLVGLGGGLTWAPTTSAAMGSAPTNRLGVAGATLATWRNTGMVVSYALSLAIAASAVPADAQTALFLGNTVHLPGEIAAAFVDGMHATFHLSTAICLVTAIGWWFAAAPADRPRPRDAAAAPAVALE
jgi:EmrB/QacA subfamily drug resistance transporter